MKTGPPSPSDEAGFVLVTVLLTLLAMAAVASAGLILTRVDTRMAAGHRASLVADNTAQRGLARYLSTHRRPGGAATYALGEDTARVTLVRLLETDPTTGDTLLEIVSHGVVPSSRGDPARRVVRRLVLWGGRAVAFPAAATSSGSVDLESGGAELSGVDACGTVAVAGAAVPRGGWMSGEVRAVSGSPPVDSSYGTGRQVLETMALDSAGWIGVRSGATVAPDVVIAGPSDWPDFDTIPAVRWPVLAFESDIVWFEHPDAMYSGRGTLVVQGDFSVDRTGFSWAGLILAGGDVRLTGGETIIEGAVVGGLDELLGRGGGRVTIGGPGTRVQYSSCNTALASPMTFRTLSPVPGTWRETF